MTTRAFQKIYTKIDNITKATVTLRATGVGNDELATVGGKLAQVVKIMGENVTLQIFAGTEGLSTDSEVVFHGEPPKLRVSDNLAGRFFNAYGEPLEGGGIIEGEAREIGGPTVNPFRRIQPSELIATGIAGIDLNNTIVTGQKIPFFADPDQPYNAVMANVALRAKADKIILKVRSQLLRCFITAQIEQSCHKVDYIPLGSAAEAEEIILVQLQARMPVVVERAASHTIAVDIQPVVFCGLLYADCRLDDFIDCHRKTSVHSI